MSLESFLQEWNRKIEEQRKELLSEAHGFNPREGQRSWWSRNYIKIVMYGFLGLALGICYIYNFVWPLRILGLMLTLLAVRYVWTKIKQVWTYLKAYRRAQKLLKQASHLKRE